MWQACLHSLDPSCALCCAPLCARVRALCMPEGEPGLLRYGTSGGRPPVGQSFSFPGEVRTGASIHVARDIERLLRRERARSVEGHVAHNEQRGSAITGHPGANVERPGAPERRRNDGALSRRAVAARAALGKTARPARRVRVEQSRAMAGRARAPTRSSLRRATSTRDRPRCRACRAPRMRLRVHSCCARSSRSRGPRSGRRVRDGRGTAGNACTSR